MTTTVAADTARELARIDHALAVQDAVPTGDADWLPGDPIHDAPRGCLFDEQTIRPMLDLFDDDELALWAPRCEPCNVSWTGPDPCWVCGTERVDTDSLIGLIFDRPFNPFPVADMARTFEETGRAAARALQEFAAQLDRVNEQINQARPPEPVWHANARCILLPSIENVAAPTVAELTAGHDLDDVLLGFDGASPPLPPVVAVVRRRDPRPWMFDTPRRLPVDGHAYHRRRRARTRRNR